LAKKIHLSESNKLILLDNIARGAEHVNVGFEDAARTRGQLEGLIISGRALDMEVLESALWSANLLNEEGSFYHPAGLTFDQFVEEILPTNMTFDRFFNLIKES
jgi:hypothetical protein